MHDQIGSRGYYFTDFKCSGSLSGININNPLHLFKNINVMLVRADLVTFCHEYLSYKFDVSNYGSLVLEWSSNDKKFNNKVYRETLRKDYHSTAKILNSFRGNFLKSETEKIKY